MKRIWWAVALSLCCTTPALASSTVTTVDALETDLDRLCGVGVFSQEIAAVQRQLPQLRDTLAEADSLSQLETYQVDLIGQWHWQHHETAEEHQKMLISQKRVAALLDSLRYEVIGSEGMPYQLITRQSISAEVRDVLSQKYHGLAPLGAFDDAIWYWLQTEGAYQYIWRHKHTHVIGFEDQSLLDLGSQIYTIRDHQEDLVKLMRSGHHMDYLNLTVALRQVRTEVALAQVILELHRLQQHRGVVILGIAHYQDWQDIMVRYPNVHWQYFPSYVPTPDDWQKK